MIAHLHFYSAKFFEVHAVQQARSSSITTSVQHLSFNTQRLAGFHSYTIP